MTDIKLSDLALNATGGTGGPGTISGRGFTGSQGQIARQGVEVISNVLGNNQSQNIDVVGYKSYVLMQISTSHACWIRFYSDAASRISDQSREISIDPVAGSGIIAEFITNGNVTQKVTPLIFGSNLESTPTDMLYLRITNLSGTTTAINTNIVLAKLET